MRYKMLLFAALSAGAYLLWCTRAPEPHEPGNGEEAGANSELAEEKDESAGVATATPRASVSARPSRPSLSAERVDFDRRPWNPHKELKEVYLERARLSEAFDRFCEEAGISDEKARQIMLILYDYQENKLLIQDDILADSPYDDKWELERRLHETALLTYLAGMEGHDRLHDLLSPDERRVWRRVVRPTNIWLFLSIKRMIGPVPRE